MPKSTSHAVKITALPIADAAKVMASAYGRRITEDQVREVAERGGLIKPDGTINLLEFTAFLIRQMSHSNSARPDTHDD